MKDNKIFRALDGVDEEFLLYAMPKRKKHNLTKILSIAASFVIVIGVAVALALSGMLDRSGGGMVPSPDGGNHDAEEDSGAKSPFASADSDFSRLVAVIDKFKNNSSDNFAGTGPQKPQGEAGRPSAPEMGDEDASLDAPDGGEDLPFGENSGGDDNYFNQSGGVVNGDSMKITDKYIFRIASTPDATSTHYYLRVYSVDKENSSLISEFKIPTLNGESFTGAGEMHLSRDERTLTLIMGCHDLNNKSEIIVCSLDVGDVKNIKQTAGFSLRANSFYSRKVDGRILLFTRDYRFRHDIDMNDYSTFIPYVKLGDDTRFIHPDKIVSKDIVNDAFFLPYTTVLMIDEKGLNITDSLSYVGEYYYEHISKNNLFLSKGYSEKSYLDATGGYYENKIEITVFSHSKGGFIFKGVINVSGSVEGGYSLNEKDGYLRIVTTNESGRFTDGSVVKRERKRNASLYVVDLYDNSVVAFVERFATDSDMRVTAVSFDDDECWVSTSYDLHRTDIVYLFDLSDYSSIGYTETSLINGHYSTIVDIGEGYLLNLCWKSISITQTNLNFSLELFKKDGDSVLPLDELTLNAYFSTQRKAYLINRKYNLFGFAVDEEINEVTGECEDVYLVVKICGDRICVIDRIPLDGLGHSKVRAAMVDGYIYITTYRDFVVKKVELQ